MSLRNQPGIIRLAALMAFVLPAAFTLSAQYPGQVKPKDKNPADLNMRSVVVVEWTGELAKPKASHVVPISVWDGGTLQDAGIYLARPQPLALDGGVVYELQQNGKKVGLFEIDGAARQQNSWLGLGKWKALPTVPSPEEMARKSASFKIDADNDEYDDKPVLHRKQHSDDAGGDGSASGPKSTPDPDRPTLHRDDNKDTSGTSANGGGPPPDPDRPRIHAGADSAGSSDDPDRPKLGRRPATNANMDEGPVSSVPSSGDPNRPKLKRGIPEGLATAVTPDVIGLPPDMKQQVGVSDPRPTKEHTWEFTWADPDDQRKMKETLEDEARKALGLQPAASTPAAAPKHGATAASARRKSVPPPEPPAPAPLFDEQFRAFELSYGGGATMVFSAHTDGSGPNENGVQRFVTIVAQPDLYGSVVTILKSVTDAAHLDVKPRMRLVDAVDALGDNRGELLFELRGHNQRQFALYRVLRGQATQIFETGSTYFGSAGE